VVRPASTEGPFFVDERLQRADIRRDPSDGSLRAGLPLALTFLVSQITNEACTPLPNAIVDIWHCDAEGRYSDEAANNTAGQKFLRGYQFTDAQGQAEFLTIYPGWYPGRAVHIHFKIRVGEIDAPSYEFTSQLFFDDTLSDAVLAQPPYADRGVRNVRNANDSIYRNTGQQLLLNLEELDGGYAALFDIGLQMG
jgi:protocatechuate 3,4-dioxygenase beta subunit